jgi:tRNA(fMet)-specific endonuclease VapC
MNTILLDTNAYTGLINGDTRIYEQITQADIVYMSTVILGELYAGFHGGSKSDWNSNILRDFLEMETVKIIDVTHGTARIFGVIKNELKQKAKMIPVNDIWIAAHAIETDSTLLTYDKHFANISNLKIWS